MYKTFIKIILSFLFILFFMNIYMYFCQDNILYQPNKNLNNFNKNTLIHSHPTQPNHNFYKIEIHSDFSLTGWFHFKRDKFKTILFFHGNSGNLENRIYKLNKLSELPINYLIISYRGFNGNQGKPSEKGFYKDAYFSKLWLNKRNIKDMDVILFGESLGCGVAIELGSNYDFSGIILESPFSSVKDVFRIRYPFLTDKIVKDEFDNISKIKYITYPKLFLLGKNDSIIPHRFGIQLYNEAIQPKYKYITNCNHMLDFNNELIKRIEEFIYSLS